MDADLLGREIHWIEILGKGLAPAAKAEPEVARRLSESYYEVKLKDKNVAAT
jgi:hypothetical protein